MANYYVSSRAYEDITPWGGQQNMLLQSNAFTTTWTATNATATQGTDADPAGGTTAWRLIDNSTNAGHGISQSITKAASALRYTFSCYAKAGPTLSRVALVIGDSASIAPTNGQRIIFDLANNQCGVVPAALGAGFTAQWYRIEPVYNRAGWYRLAFSILSGTGTTLGFAIQTDNATGLGASTVSYVGASNYVLVYGAQLEPTNYIAGAYTATTTTAVAQTVSFSATVGMIRRPTDPGRDGFAVTTSIGIGAESAYRCTTAGTTGSVEPSAANGNPWNAKAASTVTDNVAVWTEITGNESFQTAGSWAPYARLQTRLSNNMLQVNTITSFPAGGASYVVGDVLLITGVAGTVVKYPVVKVSTVSAGAITAVTIMDAGLYTSGTTALATTKVTGSGSGATITLTTSAVTPLVAGDNIYLGNTHAEWNPNNTFSITVPGTAASPNIFTSVDQSASGHIPPTSVDYLIGAQIGCFGNTTNHSLNGSAEYYGITFQVGVSNSSTGWQIGSGGQKFVDCAHFNSSGSTGTLLISGGSGPVAMDNTTWKVSSTASNITNTYSFQWRNTANAIQGATIPISLINAGAGVVVLEGLDLSALGANRVVSVAVNSGNHQIIRCKLGSSTIIANTATTPASTQVDVVQSDGVNTYRNERYWAQAILITDTTVVRTGGAADGTTAISWKIATTANNAKGFPFETMRSSIYNLTIGSSVNVSIFGVCNQAAPTTADLWLFTDYLGTTGSPLGSIATQISENRLVSGVALTADTSAWDTGATARANTTVYSVGQVIKVSTNTSRIFICTTAGTSAGSVPGGYATAVDGGSVTDNTAVFIAGYRFKQTLTVTPRNVGLIHTAIKISKASTTALYWVDPQIVLS